MSTVKYCYRVKEHLMEWPKGEYFDHTQDFRGPDLRKSKDEAFAYYHQRSKVLEERGQFFGKPFAVPGEQVAGLSSIYSIEILLVQEELIDGFGELDTSESEYDLLDPADWQEIKEIEDTIF